MNKNPTIPIARGVAADRVETVLPVILDIRDSVARRHARAPLDPTVGNGLAGSILLNRYLFEVQADSRFERSAEEQLDAVLDNAARLPLTMLYSGTVGVAWLLAHLSHLDRDEPDVGDLDDILAAVLDQKWRGPYDVITGIVGVGLYALERMPHPNGRQLLGQVVDQLEDMSASGSEGHISWFTPPELVPRTQIDQYPLGYYNLGLAHGVPGCLRLLAEAIRNDVRAEKAADLVSGVVPWILSKLQHEGERWSLPAFATGFGDEPHQEPRTRLAWCYNELGAMTAVVAAAKVCDRGDWLAEALTVLRSTLGSRLDASGCRDASLCHGTAGVAHIYRRLGEDLSEEVFLTEARKWFDWTLEKYHPGTGCGGYAYFNAVPTDDDPEWSPRAGFLEGSTGIALALLSATFDIGSTWDRLLALS